MGEEYQNEWLEMMKLSLSDFRKARMEYSRRLWSGERFNWDD